MMEFLYCFEVYLPLVYNDGRMIEPEKFERIKEEILSQFGGITMTSLFGNPIYDGFWTELETGHVHQDKNAIFTVLTPQTEESRHFFLDKKAEWALPTRAEGIISYRSRSSSIITEHHLDESYNLILTLIQES